MEEDNNTKEKSFAKIITEKIRSEGITPRSKYITLLIQGLLWIPWFFVTLIGIIGVAGIIFTASFSGWQYNGIVRVPSFLYILQTFSVIWVICLVLFSVIVIKAFRITKKGYRVSPITIITISLVVSIAGGALLYIGDKIVAQNQLLRRPIQARQQQLWAHPYKGRMVGVLLLEDGESLLRDTAGSIWKLDMSEVITSTYEHGSPVRVVGIPLNDQTFKVCRFLPLSIGVPQKIERRSGQKYFVSEEEKNFIYEKAKEFSCERNLPLHP